MHLYCRAVHQVLGAVGEDLRGGRCVPHDHEAKGSCTEPPLRVCLPTVTHSPKRLDTGMGHIDALHSAVAIEVRTEEVGRGETKLVDAARDEDGCWIFELEGLKLVLHGVCGCQGASTPLQAGVVGSLLRGHHGTSPCNPLASTVGPILGGSASQSTEALLPVLAGAVVLKGAVVDKADWQTHASSASIAICVLLRRPVHLICRFGHRIVGFSTIAELLLRHLVHLLLVTPVISASSTILLGLAVESRHVFCENGRVCAGIVGDRSVVGLCAGVAIAPTSAPHHGHAVGPHLHHTRGLLPRIWRLPIPRLHTPFLLVHHQFLLQLDLLLLLKQLLVQLLQLILQLHLLLLLLS
mmetsp:Transcript_5747/g.10770  ORF Transcript_5747/g.10770 Transcript_5747/m.10770 type:complete len:353 (-) Transcript_5747:320-1378(-)